MTSCTFVFPPKAPSYKLVNNTKYMIHAWFHTACRKLKISKTLSRYKELI
jgi:hypothetical protein